MTQVSIGLSQSGPDNTRLTANVSNDLQVSWNLTDAQLMVLVAQGLSIIKAKASHKMIRAEMDSCDFKKIIEELQK